LKALDTIKKLGESWYTRILTSHNPSSNFDVIPSTIEYVQEAKIHLDKNVSLEEYKKAMWQFKPEWKELLDFYGMLMNLEGVFNK
jgi:hypothetical protein